MKYIKLREKIVKNLFSLADVAQLFPQDSSQNIKTQLSRFSQAGLLFRIKRGLYCFDPKKISPLVLANKLLEPSYVSLETTLNFYGVIPDIPQAITSISSAHAKDVSLTIGRFSYDYVNPKLYFGFNLYLDETEQVKYFLAEKEKALLDWFLIRKIKSLANLRLDLRLIDRRKYLDYQQYYPKWVQRIKLYD